MPGDEQFIICCAAPPSIGAAAQGHRLVCRFGETDVPAEYNPEKDCVFCRPQAPAAAAPGCHFSLLDADDGGRSLLEHLLNEDDFQREDEGEPCCKLQQAPCCGVAAPAFEVAQGGEGGTDPSAPGDGARVGSFRARYSALRPFVIISTSYLLFTITDGAVRMIVLFHAYSKGFSAMEVAIMFSLYELAGVFTNFLAGIAGARWGIKSTLLVGLSLQLAGIGMLFGWQDSWTKAVAIIYVTISQMLCGIAKDLTKLGGKTVTKLVTPDEKQSSLFKLVAFITGFKNSLKGAGYFLGAVFITISYYAALGVLLGLILLAMPWAILGLSSDLGRTRKENLRASAIFKKNHNVNVLSLSRVFLFGCRDLWFEVPLPFFMRNAAYGLGWGRASVGAVLAVFIIAYGQIQSWTPQLVTRPLRQSPPNKWAAALWCAILAVIPVYLGAVLLTPLYDEGRDSGPRVATLLPGIAVFAAVFAVNSSIHSYAIVRYSNNDKVAQNVGFYYMSNAVGRLTGTLAGGALYSYAGGDDLSIGLSVCFWVSVAFAALSSLIDIALHDNAGGLSCGPCITCCVPEVDEEAPHELSARSGTSASGKQPPQPECYAPPHQQGQFAAADESATAAPSPDVRVGV